ncbi:MAG: 50S ribosomal protein LX [Crenarchaeota archaeon]|nr:50S ribosomal protein LX [Thermoproteota archaeon]
MATPIKGVKIYRVIGEMKVRNTWQKFKIDMLGTKISEVIEKTYSILGSRHKLNRQLIRIQDVQEIDPEEARDEIKIMMMLDKVVKF